MERLQGSPLQHDFRTVETMRNESLIKSYRNIGYWILMKSRTFFFLFFFPFNMKLKEIWFGFYMVLCGARGWTQWTEHFQLRIFSDKLKEMQRNMFKYTCPNYFKSLFRQLKISRKWEKILSSQNSSIQNKTDHLKKKLTLMFKIKKYV